MSGAAGSSGGPPCPPAGLYKKPPCRHSEDWEGEEEGPRNAAQSPRLHGQPASDSAGALPGVERAAGKWVHGAGPADPSVGNLCVRNQP